MKSPIEQYLAEQTIRKHKLSFSEFMDIALFHKDYGYYNKPNIFGHKGDFTTSPISSPLFGESIALSLIHI